jgi:L-lysine exporter family protein LysE/ArgO
MITLLTGFFFTLAILPGIGPQNLNTLSHGIKKNHHYLVGTTCVIADGVLIIIGCLGLKLSDSHSIILTINIVGILFISYYIISKIKNLFKAHTKYKINLTLDDKKTSIIRAIILTWLNPLVFIDIIIIIGGASKHYTGVNWYWFTLGAILGDIIWIYGLVFISSKLSNKLNNPTVWIILDIFTICIMIFILYKTLILIIK